MPTLNTKRYQVVEPVLPCGIYRHYKGGFYQLLGIAAHSETNELMVVYVSLDANREGPRMRVRPLEMFLERVQMEKEGETDTLLVPRFEWMGNHFIYGPTPDPTCKG